MRSSAWSPIMIAGARAKRPSTSPTILARLHANAATARRLIVELARRLPETPPNSPIDTNLDAALITSPDARDPAMLAKLDASAGGCWDEPAAALCAIPRHPRRRGRTRTNCCSSCPFRHVVLGRPGYLHGGAIAGLLEFAAFGALYEALGDARGVTAKPVNVTVQYMRGGTTHDTFAAARVTRLGNRVANVEAHAWQLDRAKPIAAAQLNVLLRREPRP